MKVSRQKSLGVFVARETFLYENYLRWHYSHMDLRGSMSDSTKVFLGSCVYTICHETFLPQNFHGIRYIYIAKHKLSKKHANILKTILINALSNKAQ